MKGKSSFSIIVLLASLFACIGLPVIAEAKSILLSFTDLTGNAILYAPPGESFYAVISVDDASDVAGAAVTLEYDRLRFDVAENNEAGADYFTALSNVFLQVTDTRTLPSVPSNVVPSIGNKQTSGKVMLSGAYINPDPTNGGGGAYTGQQTLFKVKFKVKDDAVLGEYSFVMKQSEILNEGAGWGSGATPEAVPVLVGAVGKQHQDWNDLSKAYPILLGDVTHPFDTVQKIMDVDIFHIITATSGPNGSISCTPNSVNYEGSSTCTASPAAGYTVDAFTVDGSPATFTNNQYVFSNVTENHAAKVTFALKPVITVKATVAKAMEEGHTTGTYRITRKGSTTADLTVYFAMSGTATAHSDYTMLNYTSATIPAGAKYADVVLTAIDDGEYDPAEKAILTISADSTYDIGKAAVATITITDDESVVTVKASPAKVKEAGLTAGKYRITRTGSTTAELTVYFAMNGTATAHSDYTMLSYTSATIPAGAKYVDVVLTAIDDGEYDPAETAILTISADSTYGIGKAASATITIIDNDPKPLLTAMKAAGMTGAEENQTKNTAIQRYDFNLDGKPDILWQKKSGELQLWYMDNDTQTGHTDLEPPVVDACWKLVGVADFNSDGKLDILLQNQCGEHWPLSIWYMDDYKRISETLLQSDDDVEAGWKAVGVDDFNADGKPDIVFQHQVGERCSLSFWYMEDNGKIGASTIEPEGNKDVYAQCMVAGVADFNADGKPDILFQHQVGEQWPLSIWYMDNNGKIGASFIEPGIDPDATVQAAQGWRIGEVADFNGDGNPDILWESQDGLLYLWYLDGRSVVTGTSILKPPYMDPEWR